ncbi:hypothetical protein LJR235_000674 [Pararhizobium sp. LjRoot235]|uniref:hypothetical protein n=1 Tax=Pararhizobium sp. LjRoot235 TaxID=3342291 RepID=UPI003ECE600D
MRNPVLALIRLGPSAVYALAAMFLISMILLTNYPSGTWAWWLHMTILPVMREPISLLLAAPGVTFWSALTILTLAALLGINLAIRPERYPKTGFIHAHVALIVTGLAMVRVTNAQAGLSSFSLPQVLRGDWSMLQITDSLLGMALLVLAFLACLCSHIAIIRRICA